MGELDILSWKDTLVIIGVPSGPVFYDLIVYEELSTIALFASMMLYVMTLSGYIDMKAERVYNLLSQQQEKGENE